MTGVNKLNFKLNENGLTLIEVLASVVILTLIITTFLMMFLQSAKTNKASEKIIDSTYYAQVEMENIYAISELTSFENRKTEMKNRLQYETSDSIHFIKDDSKSKKYYEAKLEVEKKDLVRLIVRIYNNKDEKKLEAQMETLLAWETEKND